MIMSKKALQRKTLLEAVRHGKLTLTECSNRLSISYRQMKRIWGAYRKEGDQSLCHKNRGKLPGHTYPNEFYTKVIALYQQKYVGFGPTLASEKLAEDDGVIVNNETLRLWLKKAGLWTRKRKHVIYRERRERRSRFGDLIQIDGSIHDWFSQGKHDCLLNMVDDATGTTFALLDTGETTHILLTCLKRWIKQYGVPKSVYVDLKSVYVGAKHLRDLDDDTTNDNGFSVFQQVCKALDIEIIKAYSPQAKGRVERKHQVFQDRFLKDLTLYGIKTLDEANKYLESKFLSKINEKFAITAADLEDGHRDPKSYGDLDEIICWKYQRQIRNDWSIRFKNEYFQLKEPEEKGIIQPGQFVTLKKYLNGDIRFWHNQVPLKHGVLHRKPESPSKAKTSHIKTGPIDPVLQSAILKKNSQSSPWRKTNRLMFPKKQASISHQKSMG